MLSSEPMVRWLIEQGADVNAPSPRDGRAALALAAGKGNLEIAQALIEAGADVNLLDEAGAPPIKGAIERGHTEIVQALVDRGARLDRVDPSTGRTLFHLAAIYGHGDLTRIIHEAGGYTDQPDSAGFSPFDYACRYGHYGLARMIGDGRACEAASESDEVGTGEAKIHFLAGRGWAIRTAHHNLVFDAEEFVINRPDQPSLANGFPTPAELRDRATLALYTCYHGGEGELSYIHTLEDSLADIRYVHHEADPWRGCRNTVYLAPYAHETFDGVRVHTITPISYMPSLAFLVEIDGLNVYYADVVTDDLDKYRSDLDSLVRTVDRIDIAFLQIGETEPGAPSDFDVFVEKFRPAAVVLVDANRRFDALREEKHRLESEGFAGSVFVAEYPGDRFDYKQEDIGH
jgi:hypothetical protein